MKFLPSYDHVYLSPHYDDASLSCGGAIRQQVRAGETVLVVTVCAAPPKPGQSLSPFAEALHHRWGNPPDLVATRRAEDRASMEILGADFRRLDFTDCIYRGKPQQGEWYYNSNTDLFGQIHPADLALTANIVEAIVETVPRQGKTVTYAPLAVGNHVDHQLVHEAARHLQLQGWTITFYEDFPYVDPDYPSKKTSPPEDNPHTLEATLAAKQAANLKPQLRPFSEEDLQAKISSVRAYVSQLQMLFGSEMAVASRVRNYALSVGEGKPAERIWRPA